MWLALLAVTTAAVAGAFLTPLEGAGSAGSPPEADASGRESAEIRRSPTASPSASPSSVPLPPVTVVAGGDVMGAWGVDAAIRARGADYVMRALRPALHRADFAFLNVESPLSDRGSPQTWKDVYFRGNPKLVGAIARAGVDVVTMANNHCLDYKAPALLDTIRRLNAAGVKVVGAGRNDAAAWTIRYVTRKGVKIGFMGWTDIMPPGYKATATSAGAAVGPTWSGPTRTYRTIKAAKKKADYVVVAFHWGVEGTHYPIQQSIHEAHAAIDAGADLVMSHHPHYLQGVERYHGGLIMYSFGDLVFPPRSRPAAETVLMTSTISRRKIVAVLTPFLLDSNGVPHLASGASGRSILKQMRQYSRARGTNVVLDLAHNRATVTVYRKK